MASPTAIKALTGRLEFQPDEPNISFDPLMNSGRDTESPHGMRERLWFCWSVPIVWRPRVCLQDLERVSPAEWRGDLWLLKLSPLAASVEACEGAISIRGRGKDDWRHAIECLRISATIGSALRASAAVARGLRVTLRHVVGVHLQMRRPD
jgi:hypothetical protein